MALVVGVIAISQALSHAHGAWLDVTLGLLGVLFTAAVILLLAFGTVGSLIVREWATALFAGFFLALLSWVFIVVEEHPTWEGMHHFGTWQFQGISFLVVLLINVFFNWNVEIDWPSKRKRCAECASMVDGRARLCPWCGHRWDPPL